MEISEKAKLILEEKGITISGVDTVESYCDKRSLDIIDPATGLHYMHAQVGRNTIWLEFTETDGKRELQDVYAHRMAIRDELSGPCQYQEGATPDTPYCRGCNAALVPTRTHMHYLCYPFVKELPRCPICGQLFISPEFMRERLAPVEKGLEDK